jgi:hypothetical protein
MIVFDPNYLDLSGGAFLDNLDYQAPLIVKPHGMLVLPLSLQPLHPEAARRIEVAQVCRCPYGLHSFAEATDDRLWVVASELRVRLKAVKIIIGKLGVHSANPLYLNQSLSTITLSRQA